MQPLTPSASRVLREAPSAASRSPPNLRTAANDLAFLVLLVNLIWAFVLVALMILR